jgi:environmental stress-induced protein Ves
MRIRFASTAFAFKIRTTSAMNRLITPADWISQPWKNGLGVTHEVWRHPTRDDYDVRVSVAEDTTPAPFSKFPGYRRWSVLLEPAPITLSIDGVVHELAHVGDVVEHDGTAEVLSTALPAGPTRLLNVLAKSGIEVGVSSPAREVRFVFAIESLPDLPRGHARVFDPPVRWSSAALWIAY